jgi:hypothetical protein
MSETDLQIQENYIQVCEQIQAAAIRAGRQPQDVRLIVVTKTHSMNKIKTVIEAGARNLGENYTDEAIPKIQALMDIPDLHWHMIGHVQSRKAKFVSAHFDTMHSLDSIKLALKVNQFALEQGRVLPVLLECNTSHEESKFGFPAWDETAWPALADELQSLQNCSALSVRGLMTMCPFFRDPEMSRPFYRRLRRLQEYLASQLPFSTWSELSMGMSMDFKIAIEEGATWVRIGTRIMGEREIH